MTAKKFVLQRKPTAKAEKQKTFDGSYFLIREKGKSMYIASGKTEEEAWKRAKEILLKMEGN